MSGAAADDGTAPAALLDSLDQLLKSGEGEEDLDGGDGLEAGSGDPDADAAAAAAAANASRANLSAAVGASVGALANALLRSAVPGETREMVADGLALGVARDEPKRLSFDLPPGAPVAFPLVRRSQSVLEAAVADEDQSLSAGGGLRAGGHQAANECKGWCATALHCEQKGNCGGCSFCGGAAAAGDDADVVLVQYRSNPYTHALLPGCTAVAAKIVCEKQQRVRSRVVDVELRRRGEVIQVKGISQPVRIAFAAEEEDGGDSRRLDEAEPCNPWRRRSPSATRRRRRWRKSRERRRRAATNSRSPPSGTAARDECVADANATLTEATAAAERCEAMPKPCSGRGECVADGSCTCDPGWTGGGCESPLKCGWYDGQRRAWSTDGCVPAAPVAGEHRLAPPKLLGVRVLAPHVVHVDRGGGGGAGVQLVAARRLHRLPSAADARGARVGSLRR